jgi:hypothetical protein
MRTSTRALTLALAGAALASAAPDRELAGVLKGTKKLVQAGQTGRAEALLESLTRARPDDPRAWYYLAELRAELKAPRSATYAYHRAAGLSSDQRRKRIGKRLEQLELPALPERDHVDDAVEFLDRARSEICARQDRTGEVFRGLDCEGVARVRPSDFRVSKAVLKSAGRSEQEWVRVQAAAHAPLALFQSRYLAWLLRDPSPMVREAMLRRLVSGAGELELPAAAAEAVVELMEDPDLQVRLAAADFAFRRGGTPTLGAPDFRELVLKVDRGQASKAMARGVLASGGQDLRDELVQLVREPGFDGKASAIMLLCLDGGREGQRAVARAFVEGGEHLGHFFGHAYQGLRIGTRGQKLDLGMNPSDWLVALGG